MKRKNERMNLFLTLGALAALGVILFICAHTFAW